MALSDNLCERVVDAVVVGGLSRNAAAKLFKVSMASAVRWVIRTLLGALVRLVERPRIDKRQKRLLALDGGAPAGAVGTQDGHDR